MTHTFRVDTTIPPDRHVTFTLPDGVPTGDAEVVLVVVPKSDRPASTAKDLLSSEIVGMWQDRVDIEDSSDFAREVRDRAWHRANS